MEQYEIMEQYGIMDCLDHPTDFCFALTATALVNNMEAAAVLYQRGAHPRNNHPGLQKSPIFPNPPEGCSFPPSGSSAAPAAARRGRPGPAAADGGEGRCGAGGPPASPPVTPPGPPGRLPASLRCLLGPSVLGRPSPSWIRGAAAAVARSHDDSSLERQPVSAENLLQHRRYLKSGKKKDFLMISKVCL